MTQALIEMLHQGAGAFIGLHALLDSMMVNLEVLVAHLIARSPTGAHIMPAAALLHIALLCAAWQVQPVASQRLDSLEGAPARSVAATPELIPLRTSGSKAAAAAGVPPAMATKAKNRWWEHSGEDDTKCEATYAGPRRVVGLTSAVSARACSDTCRCCTCCRIITCCCLGLLT